MATIPKDVLISYDISSKHDDVKDAMYKLGYQDYMYQSNARFNLPESTLYHSSKYSKTVYDDFQKVINDINANLEQNEKITVDNIVAVKADDFILYSITK